MKARTVWAALLAALCFLVAAGVGAQAGTDTGTAGFDVTTPAPSAFVPYGGFRFQAVGSLASSVADEELGVAGLEPTSNRIEDNFSANRFTTFHNTGSRSGDCVGNYVVGTANAPASNAVSFGWDPSADTLTSRFATPTLNCALAFSNVAQELANAEGWTLAQARSALTDVNALRVLVDARQAGTQVDLSGAKVDGVALGRFDPGAGSQQDWLATGYDFDAPNGFTFSGSLDLGGTFGTCDTNCAVEVEFGHIDVHDRPPVVADHAADVSGDEGSALATHGSFTDPDGDPLTITGTGVGTVSDHGDGTWSWHYLPPDDGSGTVTVAASDGTGGTASDVFHWSAANVPPTIVSLTPTATTAIAGADVTWTATATDPGTADTFTWWFDGGPGTPGGLTTTFTRSYPGCGTYSLHATVADDDGGSDSATSSASISVADATMLPPLGPGLRSVKAGSVVPVRVWIGCDGTFWSGLHPTVTVAGGGAVDPALSADGGGDVMREVGGAYLFNLRVPQTMGGAAVTTGAQVSVVVEPFGDHGAEIRTTLQIR